MTFDAMASARHRLQGGIEYDTNGGCWLWSGAPTKWGYGALWFDGAARRVHRVAWSIFRGEIPPGMFVCHKCDVPMCINPDHLFLGTAADNNKDRALKGRSASGERSGRAKLTEVDVALIRSQRGGPAWARKMFGIGHAHYYAIVNGKIWNK